MNEINKLFGVNIKDIAYVFLADNKWYEFDDSNVSEIDENKLITDNAYCLFYRKKKI